MTRILLLLLLSSFFCSGQNSKKAHDIILLNKGQTIECNVINFRWKSRTDFLSYKLDRKGKPKKINLDQIKAVNFKNGDQYIVEIVEIDNNSNELNSLKVQRQFMFDRKRLLLKKLVKGKAMLYASYHDGIEKLFYKTEATGRIVQLLYKRFLMDDPAFGISNYRVANNNMYLRQISRFVNCEAIDQKVRLVPYDTREIIKHFKLYNSSCK